MPILTTAAAVTALWAALELVGGALREEALKETLKPVSTGVAKWIQDKTGWKDKRREKVFREAYRKAEEKFIEKHGITTTYRTFRLIPRVVDSPQREQLILAMLEREHSNAQQKLLEVDQPSLGFEVRADEDTRNLIRFLRYLRQYLWETEDFRPVIEFYALEEAQHVRERVLGEMKQLADTVSNELRAIRVVLVEPEGDFEVERQTYLEQIEWFFEEQDFGEILEISEQKKPLLREVYVPLTLSYGGGGEDLGDELGRLVVMQSEGKE